MEISVNTVIFKKEYGGEWHHGICIDYTRPLYIPQYYEITSDNKLIAFNYSEVFEVLYCNQKEFALRSLLNETIEVKFKESYEETFYCPFNKEKHYDISKEYYINTFEDEDYIDICYVEKPEVDLITIDRKDILKIAKIIEYENSIKEN